jgi:hypothetical protein
MSVFSRQFKIMKPMAMENDPFIDDFLIKRQELSMAVKFTLPYGSKHCLRRYNT